VVIQAAVNDVAIDLEVLRNSANIDWHVDLCVPKGITRLETSKRRVVSPVDLFEDFEVCWGTAHGFSRLTPELSRAAKRRRLE
jgi:hypothetical protein